MFDNFLFNFGVGCFIFVWICSIAVIACKGWVFFYRSYKLDLKDIVTGYQPKETDLV